MMDAATETSANRALDAVSVSGLTKVFKSGLTKRAFVAVRDLSLTVKVARQPGQMT